MNELLSQPLIALAVGLLIGECTEVAPWMARRILRGAAQRLGSPEATERYTEEWLSLLDERPGKLMKLFFASWIALRATWTLRAMNQPSSKEGSVTRRASGNRVGRKPRLPLRGITIPGGYTIVPGVPSKWTAIDVRAESSSRHLLILLGLMLPILPASVYVMLSGMELISGQDLLVRGAGAVVLTAGIGILFVGVDMNLSRTVTVDLISAKGRNVALHGYHLPTANSWWGALGLTFGINAKKTTKQEEELFRGLTLSIDIVPAMIIPAVASEEAQ